MWLSLLLSVAFAKDPCKAIQTAEDPFSGPTRGSAVYLDRGKFTAIGLQAKKDTFVLEALVVMRGAVDATATPADIAEIAVGDQVFSLTPYENSSPVLNANSTSGAFTQWIVRFYLTSEQMKAIAANGIKAIKVRVAGTEFLLQPDEKKQADLRGVAACLEPT